MQMIAHLFRFHAILDEQGNTGVQVTDITLEDEILLRLCRYTGLELAKTFLGCETTSVEP